MFAAAFIFSAYLAGSIPFGVVFARARGIDLRTIGSGNIGATNAARALGKKMGVVVFLCDAAKGLLPVHFAIANFAHTPHGDWLVAATGVAAFVGHLAPVWLKFRGGKGVATAFGVFVAVAPLAALVAGVVFAATYALFRVSSLGSLLAATAMMPALWAFGASPALFAMAGFMWILIVLKHRGNIARLVHGQEKRL